MNLSEYTADLCNSHKDQQYMFWSGKFLVWRSPMAVSISYYFLIKGRDKSVESAITYQDYKDSLWTCEILFHIQTSSSFLLNLWMFGSNVCSTYSIHYSGIIWLPCVHEPVNNPLNLCRFLLLERRISCSMNLLHIQQCSQFSMNLLLCKFFFNKGYAC